jgi:DNA primase
MEFKDQLKSQVDIVGVIGEYVRLKKAGTQSYKGLCPFHSEKTPSFNVHVARQFYKCFSCGASGDVFEFLMKIEGIGFFEALKSLAERNGIPMPKRSMVADEDSKLRAALFQMHDLAVANFRDNLRGAAGEGARAYLERRGLRQETIDQFGLGYSERSGRALVRLFEQQGFDKAQMEASGLVRKREDGTFYDYFRNRLMFPIHSETGKTIAFGGRALADEDNPKYLNSPGTRLYEKSHVLYNLHRAKEAIRKEDRTILVEGYMDAIGVTAAGFQPVVASCSVALSSHQVQTLKRHSHRLVVNWDPDAAGANATEKYINLLLDESMQVRIMELDGELDPDEYCLERGAAAYRERLEKSKGYFYWVADRARAQQDPNDPDARVAVLRRLVPVVQRIPDKLERMQAAEDLAGYMGIERGVVLDRFRKAVATRQEAVFERPKFTLRADERLLLNALFNDPEIGAEAIRELKPLESIGRFSSRRIFQTIFAMADAGADLRFEEVNARLDVADQNLLAEAVLAEDAETCREDVLAAIASIRRSEELHMRSELKARIKELERAGDWQEALRLTGELQGIERAAREGRVRVAGELAP